MMFNVLRSGVTAHLLSIVAAMLLVGMSPAQALDAESVRQQDRHLNLYNAHTGEKLDIVYWANGQYQDESLKKLNRFFRDFRQNEEHPIDPSLLDLLYTICHTVNAKEPVRIISGYRSQKTNDGLAAKTHGVAKKSYHTLGKAIDFQISGCSLEKVRDVALSLKAGGVGYYPRSGFIHIDTGPVRRW